MVCIICTGTFLPIVKSHLDIMNSKFLQQADDQEPTYTNYEDEDDFIDETFDYSMGDTNFKSTSSSQKYPMRCRSIYEFTVS